MTAFPQGKANSHEEASADSANHMQCNHEPRVKLHFYIRKHAISQCTDTDEQIIARITWAQLSDYRA